MSDLDPKDLPLEETLELRRSDKRKEISLRRVQSGSIPGTEIISLWAIKIRRFGDFPFNKNSALKFRKFHVPNGKVVKRVSQPYHFNNYDLVTIVHV